MDVQLANEILNKTQILLSTICRKINVLEAHKWFYPQQSFEMNISIICKDVKNNSVGNFLLNKLYHYLSESDYNNKVFYIGTVSSQYRGIEDASFTVVIDFKEDELNRCNILYNEMINALYLSVDDAKVEFGFHIEECFSHEIPNEVYWELNTWNDTLIDDGEEEKCIPEENIKVYYFKKEWLYSICLGYYGIDLKFFETDIVPELIGVLFESIEDFCYVTSFEDEENVYLYSSKELNEDNIFDIEEGLFNLLPLISPKEKDTEDTLEDLFSK